MSNKSWLEILIVPIALCAVGTYATISTTNSQIKSSEVLADTQGERSRSNQLEQKDLEIAKEFLRIIADEKACDKKIDDIQILISMSTPNHAQRLKEVWLKKCDDKSDKSQVQELVGAIKASKVNEIETLISELNGENRRTARTALGELFLSKPDLTKGLMAKALRENRNSYRIPLGILVALSYANYRYDSESELGKAIDSIKNQTSFREPTLKKWYEKITSGNG